MPLQRCYINGRPGWRWGKRGKCYPGKTGKHKALMQALAIGFDKNDNTDLIYDGIDPEVKILLKEKSRNKEIKVNKKKLKITKMLPPIGIEKEYTKYIRSIINLFIEITIKDIKPLLKNWIFNNKTMDSNDYIITSFTDIEEENLQWYNKLLNRDFIIKRDSFNKSYYALYENLMHSPNIKYDSSIDELEKINRQWNRLQNYLFTENLIITKSEILETGVKINSFNKKQWNKVLKAGLDIELTLQEKWLEPTFRTWVNRNVNLIKGMTDDYIKQINEVILNGFQNEIDVKDLSEQLTKVNKNFSKNRSKLIARDQTNKLNGQLSKRRQLDAGVDKYIWHTVMDERVRQSHFNMNGKIGRWDDETVYKISLSDKNWKSRSSISAVQLHPGYDIQCRCYAEPVFDDIIDEVNEELQEEEMFI